jgi:transketolase
MTTDSLDYGVVSRVEQKARVMRHHVIESIGIAGSGHPGGSLSSVDMIAALYFGDILEVRPEEPMWPDRDRFVLSKGHAAPALYAALAERGFFPKDELKTLRQLGSMLQGHPDCLKTPGVEVSTGSLGQGLSMAVGMALAGKLDKKDYRVWAILGDGECQEGQIWEAAMAAAHYKLDNLIAIVDHNKLQIDGPVKSVMSPESIEEKLKAFGWNVMTMPGHDVPEILRTFRLAQETKGKPTAIIADTVKGRGVSYMENEIDWHGKAPNSDELKRALTELESEEGSK